MGRCWIRKRGSFYPVDCNVRLASLCVHVGHSPSDQVCCQPIEHCLIGNDVDRHLPNALCCHCAGQLHDCVLLRRICVNVVRLYKTSLNGTVAQQIGSHKIHNFAASNLKIRLANQNVH